MSTGRPGGCGVREAGQCEELPPLIAAHTQGLFDLLRHCARTGEQPWARLSAEGHDDYWGPAAAYIERNLEAWRRARPGKAPR